MTPWFDEQTAGLVGGLLGAGIGTIFGGIGGGIGGPLAALGKARSLVIGFFYFGFAVGLALTGVGIYAVVTGQPFWVWGSFIFPGVLTAGLMGGLTPVIKSRYRQAEQRQLDAQEFAG
jgi:hypothetical protein